jgi:2-deoxy-D-gluconate 3-dehydrogenase
VLDELKAIGSPSMATNVDITDRDGLEPAFQRVERELGEVDILVNNAGHVNLSGGVLLETAADWDRVIESQLNAVFLLSKVVAAAMAARRRGKIINVGSMYSYFGSGLIPSYQRRKRGGDPVDQVDGHRTGATQHSSERHCTGLD